MNKYEFKTVTVIVRTDCLVSDPQKILDEVEKIISEWRVKNETH